MLEIAKTQSLEVLRIAPMGLILGTDEAEVLLPRRDVPTDAEPGDTLEVFVYTDSEDRPIATTARPLAQADEFACLRVVAVSGHGAFLDWGLPKDLLLPFASQLHRLRPEQHVVVRVLFDRVSGRPVATARFQRYLQAPPANLRAGQAVSWMVYEETELGSKAIVDGAFDGLFYRTPASASPGIGTCGSGYVQRVREDHKIDLSLSPVGLAGIDDARDVLLEALEREGGKLALGDRSEPAEIHRVLGLSKKAFKRAAGALYRERRVLIADSSIEFVDPDERG